MTPTSTPSQVPDFDFLNEDATAEIPAGKPKRRPNKLIIAGVAGLLLLGFIVIRRREASEVHPEVKTALVTRQTVRQIVSASGTLQAFSTIDVKSKASGAVLQLAVEEGTHVKKGQLIAVIDRQDTSAALKQANADVDAARAQLREAQANASQQRQSLAPQIKQSQEGVKSAAAQLAQARENLALEAATNPASIVEAVQTVSAAQVKLEQSRQALVIESRTRTADLQEAVAGVNTARIKLRQAQQTAQAQPSLSRSSIDSARANVASAQASLNAAQQSYDQLKNATQPQERTQTQSDVNQAQSNLKTAQANLTRQKALFDQGFVAQSTVETAQNSVDTAQAALDTAQTKLDTLQQQQDAALRQSAAQVDAARSNLKQAQANLENAQTNAVQDQIKAGDVESAQAALRQAEATLNTAKANLRQVTVKQGDVQSSLASLKQAQAALQTARANTRQINVKRSDVDSALAALRQSEAALQTTTTNRLTVEAKDQEVANAQAQLDRAEVTANNAELNLQQTRVVAPRDGVVLQKYVDVGAIIQSGQSGFSGGTSIVQLAEVDRMYVDVLVDESDIAQIRVGQKVKVTLDAYPNSPKSGRVRKIYPLAAVTSNVTYIHVQVELDAKDVDSTLRPEMNATCDFLVAEKADALAVPPAAVKDGPRGSTVTVIKNPKAPLWADSNQEKRRVTIGIRGSDAVEVTSGVKQGDTVVTQIVQPSTSTSSTTGSSGGLRARSLMGGPPR
jgi:HlyD family secretion protein